MLRAYLIWRLTHTVQRVQYQAFMHVATLTGRFRGILSP